MTQNFKLGFLLGVLFVLNLFVVSTYFISPKQFKELGDTSIGFSPKGGALNLVLSVIDKCEKTLNLAAYEFTSQDIADKLISRKNDLSINIIADRRGSFADHSIIPYLKQNGIDVKLNGNYPIHHHKFIVCDEKIVETGSFNFTRGAAKRNAENVLVLWNAPDIAKVYLEEWNRLSSESK